jgi:hypothetical protein
MLMIIRVLTNYTVLSILPKTINSGYLNINFHNILFIITSVNWEKTGYFLESVASVKVKNVNMTFFLIT